MQLFHAGSNEKDSAVAARIAARPRACCSPAVARVHRASYEEENPGTPIIPLERTAIFAGRKSDREREGENRLSSLTSWTRN